MLRIARRVAVKLSNSNTPTCFKPNNLNGKSITELEEADFDYCRKYHENLKLSEV